MMKNKILLAGITAFFALSTCYLQADSTNLDDDELSQTTTYNNTSNNTSNSNTFSRPEMGGQRGGGNEQGGRGNRGGNEQGGRGGEQGGRGGNEQGGRGSRGGNEQGGRGGMRDQMPTSTNDQRTAIEALLKEKFPEEFAKIEEMRAEIEVKIKELASKAGVEIPKTTEEILAELKEKYPTEMEEIEKLRKTDSMAAAMKYRELIEKAGIKVSSTRMPMPNSNNSTILENSLTVETNTLRKNAVQLVRELNKKFPEEMAEANALKETDLDAYRNKVIELSKKLEEKK